MSHLSQHEVSGALALELPSVDYFASCAHLDSTFLQLGALPTQSAANHQNVVAITYDCGSSMGRPENALHEVPDAACFR